MTRLVSSAVRRSAFVRPLTSSCFASGRWRLLKMTLEVLEWLPILSGREPLELRD
jgi:hypothetical protein